MKNKYAGIHNAANEVTAADLAEGEVVVEVKGFVEKSAGGNDIIELPCEVVWAPADSPNVDNVGNKIVHAIFFGAQSAITVRQLKDFFRRSGFPVPTWKGEDTGCLPLEQALPGALKLLAVHNCKVACKIKTQPTKNGPSNFLNFIKVVRIDPTTGEQYENALPEQVSNDSIVEAINTTLSGESAASVL